MKLSRCRLILSLLLPCPALARVGLGCQTVVSTRLGQMQVTGGEVDQRLWSNGAALPPRPRPRCFGAGADPVLATAAKQRRP